MIKNLHESQIYTVETYPNNISFIKGIEDKNGIRSEKTEIANNKTNVQFLNLLRKIKMKNIMRYFKYVYKNPK